MSSLCNSSQNQIKASLQLIPVRYRCSSLLSRRIRDGRCWGGLIFAIFIFRYKGTTSHSHGRSRRLCRLFWLRIFIRLSFSPLPILGRTLLFLSIWVLWSLEKTLIKTKTLIILWSIFGWYFRLEIWSCIWIHDYGTKKSLILSVSRSEIMKNKLRFSLILRLL